MTSANDAIDILLVEDDPKDLKLTLKALRSENLANSIEVARDGEEALDFLFHRGPYSDRPAGHYPRLILLDLKLPKVDGMQVLRTIKSDPATRSIPVAVLTSSTEERDLVESYALGVNSYIQKPVDFEQFKQTIKLLGMYWIVVNRTPA